MTDDTHLPFFFMYFSSLFLCMATNNFSDYFEGWNRSATGFVLSLCKGYCCTHSLYLANIRMDHYFPGEMASDVLLFVQRDKWDISSSMILKKIENLFDRIGRIQQQDQRTWDAVYVAYHSLFWFDHHLHSRQGCFLSILVKTACKTNNRILWICATHAGRTIDNFSLSRCVQQPQENIYRPSSVWRSAHFRLSPTVTCSFSFFIRSNARICIIYIENASIPLPHFPSTILALRPCFFVCFVFR